ncbi:MAG: hypothetical protein P8184_02565, partial [Calditrichia bacterium]
YEDLKKKNVAQLREIAKGIQHEAVQGYTQLNKEHLLDAVCSALNIDTHVHHVAVGIEKSAIKAEIRKLKKLRDEFIAARNYLELKSVRCEIRKLKKKLRKAAI